MQLDTISVLAGVGLAAAVDIALVAGMRRAIWRRLREHEALTLRYTRSAAQFAASAHARLNKTEGRYG